MGILDREYYRKSTRGSGWLTGAAPVTQWLVLINIGFFVLQQLAPPTSRGESQFTAALELLPRAVVGHFQFWRLLTCAFLHDGFFHIFFNLLFLWWCGAEVERIYGSREFLGFYLLAALVSSLAYLAWALAVGNPIPCLGASGAIFAVIVVYVLYNPRQVVYVYMLVPMETRWVLVIYVAYDIFKLQGGGFIHEAVAAHLGGALYGLLYKSLDLRISRLLRSPVAHRGTFRRPSSRREAPPQPLERPADAPGFQPSVRVFAPDEDLERQTDAILEKISREGADSLTDEERRILTEASQRYKDRTRRV